MTDVEQDVNETNMRLVAFQLLTLAAKHGWSRQLTTVGFVFGLLAILSSSDDPDGALEGCIRAQRELWPIAKESARIARTIFAPGTDTKQ